jgi:hypothetical protein
MGLFDNVLSRFRNNGDGEKDFVRLDEMNEKFLGPGPIVLLYQVPDSIDDDEVRDMLADRAPQATSKGISMARIPSMETTTTSTASTTTSTSTSTSTTAKKSYSLKSEGGGQRQSNNSNLIDLSLRKALETVIHKPPPPLLRSAQQQQATPTTENSGCPVVIFSGFSNSEMMDSYNTLGEELYKETASASYNGKGQYLACAKAVPNAMNKPLGQVLSEISGDHAAAMQPQPPEEEETAAPP